MNSDDGSLPVEALAKTGAAARFTPQHRPLRKDPQSTPLSRALSNILSWFPLEPLL